MVLDVGGDDVADLSAAELGYCGFDVGGEGDRREDCEVAILKGDWSNVSSSNVRKEIGVALTDSCATTDFNLVEAEERYGEGGKCRGEGADHHRLRGGTCERHCSVSVCLGPTIWV